MKLLNNEQQAELQSMLNRLSETDPGDAQLKYWALWIRPKRIKKKKEESV